MRSGRKQQVARFSTAATWLDRGGVFHASLGPKQHTSPLTSATRTLLPPISTTILPPAAFRASVGQEGISKRAISHHHGSVPPFIPWHRRADECRAAVWWLQPIGAPRCPPAPVVVAFCHAALTTTLFLERVAQATGARLAASMVREYDER